MLIFYSEAQGRPNVSSKAPIDEPAATVLQIFKSLDIRRGFLSVILEPNFVLQLLPEKGGMVKIELLDRSKPAFDWCVIDSDFAKALIELAGNGQDVFRIARETVSKWEHTDLRWVE